MTTPKKKRSRTGDEPPYTKYAFLNPYNLSLLAGAGVASAATGQWWVGVGALVLETVWMLFAPDSPALQKAWFDKTWDAERKREATVVRDEKYRKLIEHDQLRAQSFWEAVKKCEQLARDNPSMGADLIRAELSKLEELYDDFLDLGIIAGRGEAHLRAVNYEHLNRLWTQYRDQVRAYPEGDKRREIAEKNLEVLTERRRRIDELSESIAAARGQMDLLDNTVRLLGDEIMAMTAPSELGARLDELRIGVTTIRETTKDVDAVYAQLEEELRIEEQQQQRVR